MSVDRDRAQVYAAELAGFDGTDLEVVAGFDEVRRVVEAVVAGEWWPGGEVELRAARSDARSSATRCSLDDGAAATISIAAPQATVATAAHELAHALIGTQHGHGPLYRRAYLDVVGVMTNLDRVNGRGSLHVDQLAAAFADAALGVADRTWPAPPPPGGAIAL
jgi:hypothetical protein